MVIAEIGSVHDGSLGNAKNLISCAKKCGASYVKFQLHIASEETTRSAISPSYFKDENRFDYFFRTSFKLSEWKELIKHSKKNNIKFMCSVFSIKAIKNLIKLGVKNIKIPSGEVTNIPLLNYISKFKVNIFLSTGMSDWSEINTAMKILKKRNLILMQCTSEYPCKIRNVGVNIISEMIEKYSKNYNCEFGFSDHTEGNVAAILALSNGATYFEKHITFSRKMYGSDAKYATELDEFKTYCENLSTAKKIISSPVNKDSLESYKKMKEIFEKKIVFKKSFKKNKIIKYVDLDFKKSKKGIRSKNFADVIGKKLSRNVNKDDPVTKSVLC